MCVSNTNLDHSKLLSVSERGSVSHSSPSVSPTITANQNFTIPEEDSVRPAASGSLQQTDPYASPGPADDGQDDEDMPVTETEDLQTLVYLLDVQLDIQQRAIDSVLEHWPKQDSAGDAEPAEPDEDDFDREKVPGLLSSARLQVEKTVSKIVSVTHAREKKWYQKWKQERESKMRWEVCHCDFLDDTLYVI